MAVAAAICAASCLAAALIAPAFAASAGPHSGPARPDVRVVGQPVGIAADPTHHAFWVAEHDAGKHSDSVDKIVEAGHAIVNFRVNSGVDAIASDASRGLVWTIGNSASGSTHTLSYIRESDSSVHPVSVPAGSALTGLAVDPAAGKVFVLDLTGDVFTVDENHLTNAPVTFITGGFSAAFGLAIDHGTNSIWVLNTSGNSVFEYNESTGAVTGTPAEVGNSPGIIAIDATTKTVWVGNSDSTLSEFAEGTPGTVNTITLGGPATSITPGQARLIWVGGEFGSITAVSEQTSPPSLTGGLTLPKEVNGLATDPKTGQLWATENVTSSGAFNNVVPLVPTAPKVTSASSTWFAAGNAAQDQFTVRANGFPPATFSMHGAPSWLSLARFTGVLSANLTNTSKVGAFKVTITASDGVGSPARQSFTVNVGTDPVIKTKSGTFAFGGNNSLQIKASGTPAPTFTGLNLPKGLHLSKAGLLTGSLPKGAASPRMLRIEASNQVTEAFHAPVKEIFTLKLVPGTAPKFTSASRVTFRHGRSASFTIGASGFPAPTLKVVSGKLPSGLRLRIRGAGKAFISGTPTTADAGHTFKITISASNGIGKRAAQTLTIKIT